MTVAEMFKTQPLDATVGAVITDINLAKLDETRFAQLYDTWLEYALLIFPGQYMTNDEQTTFALRFGELEFDSEANDDHPPANICKGQDLICKVYGALTANLAQWSKTLFIINYDEHGGFYDHVPPHGLEAGASPQVPKIHDDGKDFYGPRVPAMLISPWIGRALRVFPARS